MKVKVLNLDGSAAKGEVELSDAVFGLEPRADILHIAMRQAVAERHRQDAVLALGGTIEYFRDTVFNYPTLAESYKVAALDAVNKMRAIAKVTQQTKADTERTIDALIDVINKNIKKKDGVKLVGFGTFATSNRKARVGRNPQTGEEIHIPARKVPVFRPGKELKDSVR